MKHLEIALKIIFVLALIAGCVTACIDGNLMLLWIVSACLWCYTLWEMWRIVNDKLGMVLVSLHALLCCKASELKKAAETEAEAKDE